MSTDSILFCLVLGAVLLSGVAVAQDDPSRIAALFRSIDAADAAGVAEVVAREPELASARNANGQSAVLYAAYRRRSEIVAVLISSGARLDIFEAAATGQTAQVKGLIRKDRLLVNSYSADGFFPLGLAAFFGHVETVVALLDAGANVNQASKESMAVTALHSAVAAGESTIARALIVRGANVNARAENGFVPLHEVSARGQLELAELLIEHGADVNAANADGKTPLALAIERKQQSMVEFLKKHNAK